MMLRCWHNDPVQRPTFAQIREQLEAVMTDGGTYYTIDINEDSNYYLEPSFNSIPEEEEEEVKDEVKDKSSIKIQQEQIF